MKKIVGNIASMLTNDVITRATTFILYALIARFLGMRQFGQMSLALTILNTFQMIAPAGLKLLITREVSRNKAETDKYLINGSIVALITSVITIILLFAIIFAIHYDPDTALIILLVSLGLLPFSLSVICEAIFQAWNQMQLIALANIPRNIIIVILSVLILSQGYDIFFLGILLPILFLLMLFIEWGLMFRHITRPSLRIDPKFSVSMLKSSSTFLGFQGIIAATGSFIYILLSKVGNESEVGLYNAATQLMTPILLIYQSVVLSVFPMMCQKFDAGVQELKQVSDRLLEFLLTIGVPAAIGLYFLAEEALMLLYGNHEFIQAAGIIRILAISLVLRAFSTVIGRVLLASRREKAVLRIVIINTFLTILSGIVLIGMYGLTGAVITSLISTIVDFAQHCLEASKLFSNFIPWRKLWKTAIASICIVAFLNIKTDTGVWESLFMSIALYSCVWAALSIASAGGIANLKARYLYFWNE